MIIKRKKIKHKKNFGANFFKYYFFFTIFVCVLFITIFFNLGIWENYKKDFFYKIYSNGIINYKHLPKILVYAIQKNFYSYDTIYVHINQRNKIILEKNRADKLDYIYSSDNPTKSADYGNIEFVTANASISIKDKTINTNIRLKGDRDIHYRDIENSSYKFNIKGENTFFGTKKFSIQKPRIRNYLHEWLFHELMAEGDLIKLKYDFLYFNLNGQNMGLYVLEEAFGKNLIERNNRRNGPIFSIDESFELTDSDKIKFEIYDDRIWIKEENINVAKKGISNLKKFFDTKNDISELFDIKKWAWYFAVIDLTYTIHGAQPKSVKFYFNPINGKFEPIPHDGHRIERNYSDYLFDFDHSSTFDRAEQNKLPSDSFLTKFFFLKNNNKKLNEDFYFEYINAIKKICSKEFLDNFFNSRQDEIKKITSAIYSDSFIYDYDHRRKSGIGIYYYDKNDTYFRANKLLNKITPQKTALFVEEDKNNIIIDSKSIHNINLKISEITCGEKKNNVINVKKTLINESLNFPKHVLNKKKYSIQNTNCNFLQFTNNINNDRFIKKIDKINGEYNAKKIDKEKYKKYFDVYENNLELKNKITEISENLLIPRNFNVNIKSGEKIILKNNAFIFSKSPWQIGNGENITYITGEKNNFGGGIIIMDTEKISKISNVKFSYLNGLQNDNEIENGISDLIILGSINFYEADVDISNVLFEEIKSEDAINIFRSNFLIKNFKSTENLSDAIDIDFSKGKIENTEFQNIGNDAIDLSGSNVNINNAQFENIGDKLISVGENSFADIYNIKASKSHVGVVSKDGSYTKVKKIHMSEVKIPFSAYKKKSAYDFGVMDLSEITLEKSQINWLTDEKSIIKIDGDDVSVKTNEIIPIIYSKKLELFENFKNDRNIRDKKFWKRFISNFIS